MTLLFLVFYKEYVVFCKELVHLQRIQHVVHLQRIVSCVCFVILEYNDGNQYIGHFIRYLSSD